MHDHPRIVRPLDTPRLTAAERAVGEKMADVLNRAGATWNPRLLANLYAVAALKADDAHASERDLVTQHFGIVRADLLAVVDLASRAVDGTHASPGRLHNGCAKCAAVFALGRVRNAVEWTDTTTRS